MLHSWDLFSVFNLAKMRECRVLALLQEALVVLGRRHACVVGHIIKMAI